MCRTLFLILLCIGEISATWPRARPPNSGRASARARALVARGGGDVEREKPVCTTSPLSGKILGYDPGRLHRWGFLRVWGVSVLANRFVWLQSAVVFGVAAVTGALTLCVRESDQSLLAGFEGLEDALHGMIIFLLGLFLSEVISRWWSLIFDCVGGLADAVDGASVLAASLLDDGAAPEERPTAEPAKATVARWGALSYALVFEGARGAAARDCVPKLSARGLLTTGEANALVAASGDGEADARVPWVWMARMWSARLRPTADPALPLALEQCLKGVSRVGDAKAYLDGQLPLPYVHLLTLMAKFNMLLMALTRGSAIATHLRAHAAAGVADKLIEAALDITRLFFVPVLYQGCFDLHAMLENPLGHDIIDLPERESEAALRAECAAFIQTRPDAAAHGDPPPGQTDNPPQGADTEASPQMQSAAFAWAAP